MHETKTSPVSPIKWGGQTTDGSPPTQRPQHAYLPGNIVETGTDSYRLLSATN
jgi:hypothetical protein